VRVAGSKDQERTTSSKPSEPGLEKRIEELLSSEKKTVFTSKEIAANLGIDARGLVLTLERMARKNNAEKTAGGYRSFSGSLQEMPLAG
jgi:hypothetical protein